MPIPLFSSSLALTPVKFPRYGPHASGLQFKPFFETPPIKPNQTKSREIKADQARVEVQRSFLTTPYLRYPPRRDLGGLGVRLVLS